MDSEISGNRRFNLDGPPPQPSLRSGEAGSSPSTPEALYDSSSGTVNREDEENRAGDRGVASIAAAFQDVAEVEGILTRLGSRFPNLYPILQDFITVLRQAVPQELANSQSMSPMSAAGAPGQTVNQLSALFGGGNPKPAPLAGPPAIGGMPPGAGGPNMG